MEVLPEGAKYASICIARLVVRVSCCMWQVVEAMEAGCAGGLGDPGALQGECSTFMLGRISIVVQAPDGIKAVACAKEA